MTRRARVRTHSADPETVAAALEPDNTPEMAMRVDGDAVETTITRETAGGLRTTLDDYAVNLSVAERIVQLVSERAAPTDRPDRDTPTDDTHDTQS